jgi:hypothetical protein
MLHVVIAVVRRRQSLLMLIVAAMLLWANTAWAQSPCTVKDPSQQSSYEGSFVAGPAFSLGGQPNSTFELHAVTARLGAVFAAGPRWGT